MLKNQGGDKKNNPLDQKISWYRRRWFWGVILVVVIGLVFWAGISFLSNIDPNSTFWSTIKLFLIQLPLGLPIIGGVISGNIFIIYYLIYYFGLLILLFQTLRRKRVKVRYPLILITIIIISYFGFAILTAFNT